MNSVDHKRRGSLVNTPDHHAKQMTAAHGAALPLVSLDDFGEPSNYLEANDSSATNSTCSFDAPPDVPPVPPRIVNPPPRNTRTAANEHLIIIDTDVNINAAPVPATRAKTSKLYVASMAGATAAKHSFENSFVSNINSLNIQKNNNGANGGQPPLIGPPPKSVNQKFNATNATETSEVRRIPSKMFDYLTRIRIFERTWNGMKNMIIHKKRQNIQS